MAFKFAHIIRVVSQTQKTKLSEKFHIPEERIIVTPLPVNPSVFNLRQRKKIDGKEIIGFVGRIHPDRGTKTFCDFVRLLNNFNQEFLIRIIGSGPFESEFRQELLNAVESHRIEFTGFLESDGYSRKLSELNVLASFAPSESYGRTIREALICGVPVLATRSAAIEDLLSSVRGDEIQVISQFNDDEKVYSQYLKALQIGDMAKTRSVLAEENTRNVESIVESWGIYVS
jgi:glycosyltransferase involved in cell wall biosynthesis